MKRSQKTEILFEPVNVLSGVGPKRMEGFERLGISRVIELLTHIPRRYEDRRALTPIGRLAYKETAVVAGTISDISSKQTRNRLTVNKILLTDTSGSILVTFFNQDYIMERAKEGQTWAVYGTCDRFGRDRTFSLKEIDFSGSGNALDLGTIRPYYRAGALTPQNYLRKLIRDALARITETGAPEYEGLPDFRESLRMVHQPVTFTEAENGRRRLALDELAVVRLCVEKARRARPPITRPAVMCAYSIELPFELTGEQKEIEQQIMRDLDGARPMRRLVEGDVGSGKTVLAILAAVHAAGRERKTAFLAPTEILAEQHFQTWSARLEKAGVRAYLLMGSTSSDQRKVIYLAATQPEPAVFFGTHALLSEKMKFTGLGLVVIDEQQRFGVLQRDVIVRKGEEAGESPDMLTLSATPIPRTLAMTLYGDLEISTLRSRLPGRTGVETIHLRDSERKEMMPRIRAALSRNERIYVIYPLIDPDEEEELRDAKGQYEKIRAAFPKVGTALLTGATKTTEKEAIMARFRSGAVSILVATSIIEVGIDVPEATLMIVEHADRFGLAQLHQLRGRVGRGGFAGLCVLTTPDEIGEYAEHRIAVLLEKQDGFEIADQDLKLRGPGEILGDGQHGKSELRVARLGTDGDLVPIAQKWAAEALDADPELAAQPFMRASIATVEQHGADLL